MNKVLKNINLPKDYKKYLNNYIKESFKLMNERGYIDEFICNNTKILEYLEENNIIEKACLINGILIPCNYSDKYNKTTYILSDYVFEKNGFKVIGV